jgi:hypothetical protein
VKRTKPKKMALTTESCREMRRCRPTLVTEVRAQCAHHAFTPPARYRTGARSKTTSHLTTAAVKTRMATACFGFADICAMVQSQAEGNVDVLYYRTHDAHARLVSASAKVFGSVRLA